VLAPVSELADESWIEEKWFCRQCSNSFKIRMAGIQQQIALLRHDDRRNRQTDGSAVIIPIRSDLDSLRRGPGECLNALYPKRVRNLDSDLDVVCRKILQSKLQVNDYFEHGQGKIHRGVYNRLSSPVPASPVKPRACAIERGEPFAREAPNSHAASPWPILPKRTSTS